MNLPSFLVPSLGWLALLALPVIIVYFLKLRRPRQEIPSLVLWQSVINDQRVNSPFQKFKRHLLLLLQLLILAALVIAAMQPFYRGDTGGEGYLPVLVDVSASMGAVEEVGGPSRLDLVKQRLDDLINNTLPGRICLIAVGSSARRLTDFTNNKRELRAALAELQVIDVPSNMGDGLRMIEALARTRTFKEVVVFTDFNLPDQDRVEGPEGSRSIASIDAEVSYDLNYQRIPGGFRNVGITAFNARRSLTSDNEGGDEEIAAWDVFVRVDGSPAETTVAEVRLIQDGDKANADILDVDLDPGQSQRLVFHIEADGRTQLDVELVPEGFDSLASDNVAFLDLPAGRSMAVWCDADLAGYRHALRPLPGIVVYSDDTAVNRPDSFDLMINSRADGGVKAAVSLFVGVIPEDLKSLLTIEPGVAGIVQWQRGSQLLQHVQLTDIDIVEEPTKAEGVEDAAFEDRGYDILAHGKAGPLILARRSAGGLAYYLLFHTDNSTLPYRVGFPVLVRNLVDAALLEAEISEIQGQSTRTLRPRALSAETTYRIEGPRGVDREVRTDANGTLSGVRAPWVGRYRILDGRREVATVGASLLDPVETSLAVADEIQVGEISYEASAERVKTDRPLWPQLALIGFFVLLIEWWYFQRQGIVTSPRPSPGRS